MRRLGVLAVIWGFSFLFIKVAGEGMTPTTVAGLRVALGAATLLVYLRLTGGSLPRERRLWGHLFFVAVFANVLPFSLLAWAEQQIPSALTAVLNAATPLFTAVASWVLLQERLRWGQVVGLLVGLVGVAVTAGLGAAEVTDNDLVGGLAAVAAGAGYGIALAWSKRNLMGIPAESAAAGQLVAASIWLAVPATVTSAGSGIHLTPTRVASIVLLGCIGTGLAYVLYYRLVADIGATRTSLVTYLVPIVAVVVGALALDERLSARQALGALLILGGCWLVNRGGSQAQEECETEGAPPADTRWRRLARRTSSGAAGLLLLVPLTALAACGGDGGEGSSGCDDPVREQLDPTFTVHLVAGADEPEYLSDPPTSGPHYSAETPTGAVDEVLPRPLQVAILEEGRALLQYDPAEVDAADAEAVASDDVVVAPNDELDDPVVLTAWTWKRTCASVDADAVEAFAAEQTGNAPGDDS